MTTTAFNPRTTVEGFSLSHAAILDPSTGHYDDLVNPVDDSGVFGDIYGVRSGTVALDTGSYDNTGDDANLSTWYWFNFANITIQGGYIPFELVALLSNTQAPVSSGSAPNDYYSMPLWTEDMQNTSPFPMLLRVPSRDQAGAIRLLDFVMYRVQFQPFNFDGPSYKNGLLLNYAGRATLSLTDEKGNLLAKKALGRLVSRPPIDATNPDSFLAAP